MRRVAAAGYVTTDYYPEINNKFYVTGNGVNVLINLMDMRNDIFGSVVSAVSDDLYGRNALKLFEEKNIDYSHIEVIKGGKTPRVPLYLVNNERTYGVPERGIMQNYKFSDEAIDYICSHEIMHSDLTGRLIDRLSEIKSRGVKIFFDISNQINHPDRDKILRDSYCCLASFKGDEECEAIDFLKYGLKNGCKIMLATFGDKGSIAYDGFEFYREGIVSVKEVVNTVGAGDSYFAGFISGQLDGKAIDECMGIGAARAAEIVGIFEPYF